MELNNVINSRNNCFNLIRMVAASLVIFSHSFALSTGLRNSEPVTQYLGVSLGYIAVDIFFLTSGLLVCKSLLTTNSIKYFIVARCLRIYPALLVSVLFCCCIGIVVTDLHTLNFLTHSETLQFVVYNSSIILTDAQYLPSVFLDAPLDRSVNGSLWTLPWELRMYFLLILLGGAYFFTRKLAIDVSWLPFATITIAIFSTSFLLYSHLNDVKPHWFYTKFFRFSSAFFIGGSLYIIRNRISLTYPLMLTASAILASSFLILNTQYSFVVYILFTPYLILCAAYLPNGKILNYNKLGDYSYGMYIYAWPIQQCIAISIPGIKPFEMFILAFVGTLMLAYCSWNYIEKPALRIKSNLSIKGNITR
ncbi:acyltransferase [Agarivorans sp. 1_MG-2023]|uniref:acyltransferase family protein n=1 Tax=Agarivorans sp. 1_MG-2023 TaxID=3062634 RepID=UPI0026E2591B|nr:acyltransferase [Agarivorans sp. 1_MG-2023]MDO6764246.1 acyltransferase [Agarivorans sp. 1_MG-2023]